uniref:Ig-like domain-containing protein n=1 Tax=Salmo trutta TaxID=8032 RepID=A0A674D9T4_SALTR
MLRWATAICGNAFEVQAPQPRVVAVYDQPAVLGCVFPPSLDSGAPLEEGLVVTWQRVEDSRVVHSFYYGTDQLARQSGEYYNRTGLFHSQLPGGNASLRLESVGPGDQGRYLCSVNNMKGTGKAEVQLKYAAFYTEPHLTVQAQHSYMTFLYETDGYPEPEVRWLDPHGHNLTHNISVTQSSRAPGLLLSLRTQLVMQAGGAVNFTFSLKNQLLEQVMERSLSYENNIETGKSSGGHSCSQHAKLHAAAKVETSVAFGFVTKLHIQEWPFGVPSTRCNCVLGSYFSE